MHSSGHRIQSRLAPSIPGSLRASAKLIASSSSRSVSPFIDPLYAASRKALGPVPEEHLIVADPCFDDFEEISYDELRASLFLVESSNPTLAANPSVPSRPRSSFSRLRRLSRRSLKKPYRKKAERADQDCISQSPHDLALVLASPKPPTSPPHFLRASPDTAPVDDSASTFFDSDPFRKAESPSDCDFSGRPVLLHRVPQSFSEDHPTSQSTSNPPCATSPSSPANHSTVFDADSVQKPARSSLKRITTFTKAHLLPSSRKSAPEVHQPFPIEDTRTSTARVTASLTPEERPQQETSDFLPELAFDRVDFSSLFYDRQSRLSIAYSSDTPFLPQASQALEPEVSYYHPGLQVFRYECVDPRDLTTSPRTSNYIGVSPTATPLTPPSPTWLSRNVKDLEFYKEETILPIPPPSPPPLPILPRSLLPVPSRFDPESQSYTDADVPESPRSTSSSTTLFISSAAPSVRSSLYSSPGSPPSNWNLRSILTYRELASDSAEPSKRSPLNLLLLSSRESSPGPQEHPLPPIYLVNAEHPLPCISEPVDSPPRSEHSVRTYPFFVPSPRTSLDVSADQFPIPPGLLAIAKRASRDSPSVASMSSGFMKSTPTVDWGEEVDYTGYEWFKDPPPRPEPQPTQPQETYVPQPGVIEQNEMFDFALRSAPNVLYARFKQYGQLGVLAWCSEFSELIDALKGLGFAGNMFVSTRTQALKTCEDILKLNLKIEMQIIIMYLSSQVARLRRFLDGDREWDDYPPLNFPLDPKAYQ